MVWFLPLFFAVANAALFGAYFDADCSVPITKTLAFTDVCTWSSNQYSGSYANYLFNCTENEMVVVGYNASIAPTCQGYPNYLVQVTPDCSKYDNIYIKGLDFTCDSENNTYNVLAHFQSDCKDGGLPFSIQLGEGTCQEGSFAPGFFNWDTQGGYSNSFYTMSLYNTTNGTCQDEVAVFQTEAFPAQCVAPNRPFQDISVDIFQAFPLTP